MKVFGMLGPDRVYYKTEGFLAARWMYCETFRTKKDRENFVLDQLAKGKKSNKAWSAAFDLFPQHMVNPDHVPAIIPYKTTESAKARRHWTFYQRHNEDDW